MARRKILIAEKTERSGGRGEDIFEIGSGRELGFNGTMKVAEEAEEDRGGASRLFGETEGREMARRKSLSRRKTRGAEDAENTLWDEVAPAGIGEEAEEDRGGASRRVSRH